MALCGIAPRGCSARRFERQVAVATAVHSNRYLLVVDGMGHVDFTTYALITNRRAMTNYWGNPAPDAPARYGVVAEYLDRFFSAFLRRDADGVLFLSGDPTQRFPEHKVTLDHHAATPPSIGFDELVQAIVGGEAERATAELRAAAAAGLNPSVDEIHLQRLAISVLYTWGLAKEGLPLVQYLAEQCPSSNTAQGMLRRATSWSRTTSAAIEVLNKYTREHPNDAGAHTRPEEVRKLEDPALKEKRLQFIIEAFDMRLSLIESTNTRRAVKLGVAIACCANLLAGCGGGAEPGAAPGPSAAPSAQAQAQLPRRKRQTSPPPTGQRTTERSPATGSRRSPRSIAATSLSFASCARTCCPRCPRCRPAPSSSPARCTSRRSATRTRSTRRPARRSGASSGRARAHRALGVQRGFAFLDGRLFRGTSDAHVLALDAADGHTLWDARWTCRRRRASRCRWRRSPRRHGLHRQRGRRPDRRHGARVRARCARRPHRLAVRRRARRSRRAGDLAEREIVIRSRAARSGRRSRSTRGAACYSCPQATPRPTSTWKLAAATTCTRTR